MFPAGYEFKRDTMASDVVAAMLHGFQTNVADEIQLEGQPLTWREAVAVAAIVQREAVVGWYRENLRDCEGVVLPAVMPWCGRHAWHLFVVRLPAHDRDVVARRLTEAGVQTVVHYPIPIHLQKAYAELGLKAGAFPQAEQAARSILSLPLFPEMTRAQCDHVCDALRAALR